jgi:pilus assembly protein CpaF
VNAEGNVFIEREGLLSAYTGVVIPERQRQAACRNIARLLGDDISEESPLLDARLPDGSRVAAVMPPASVGGTIIAIRKFRSRLFTAEELVKREMLTTAQLNGLRQLIKDRHTILISGATGSGKSTLLSALAAFLPDEARIVVIEDTAELFINAGNLVRLEARRAQPDKPAVSMRQLLRQSLRLRPDRIILGEVRGAEAFDLITVLNTGHKGSLSTIHANSARMAISRLRTCCATAGENLPDLAMARLIAETIDVIIHISRVGGLRKVTEIVKLGRYDRPSDSYEFQEVECAEVKYATVSK